MKNALLDPTETSKFLKESDCFLVMIIDQVRRVAPGCRVSSYITGFYGINKKCWRNLAQSRKTQSF